MLKYKHKGKTKMAELGKGFHRIENDLAELEEWRKDYVEAGIAEIEDFLAKRAEFLDFADAHQIENEKADAKEGTDRKPRAIGGTALEGAGSSEV